MSCEGTCLYPTQWPMDVMGVAKWIGNASLLPGHALPADCCSSLHLPSAAGLDHRRLSNWRRRVVSADCERESDR